MKQIIFLFWLTLSVNCFGQNQHTAVFYTGDSGIGFNWYVYSPSLDSVFVHGYNYNDSTMYTITFDLPIGVYEIYTADGECDGFNDGSFAIIDCHGWYVWAVYGDYGCEAFIEWDYSNPELCGCSSCKSDFNLDGVVTVADLILFMADYGETCE